MTTPSGSNGANTAYTYTTAAPALTSVTPSSGPTAGGTSVTLSGANFTGATGVTFDGTAATNVVVVNNTTITATTPAHAAAAVSVVVTTPAGANGANTAYTYATPAPTVTSISPNSGPSTGGTTVTIIGTNLSGATSVKFGSNAATFTVTNATQISATSPAGAIGVADVTVTTAGGTSATSAADQFTYGVPLDSQKLRAMQVAVTPVVAQISGQAITGAVENAVEDGFSGNPQPVSSNGSGFTFNFGAEPREQNADAGANGVRDFVNAPDRRRGSRVDDSFSALAYAGNVTKAPPSLTAKEREWLGWMDVRGMSTDRRSIDNDLKGDQVNATAGLTRKLTPDFLVGAFGGYEHFDYSSNAFNGRLKGDGWTVGGYLGWRLAEHFRFDVMVGRSGIDFNGTAGTASATFPGSRWLASTGLTATYRLQDLLVQPSVRVYALWEKENGYIDSLGTPQPDRNFSSGRASGGARASYPLPWGSVILVPNIGLFGDYYFVGDSATTTGLASTPLLQGWSARFTGALDIKFRNGGAVSFGGELGGLGGNVQVWTYRARGSIPF